MLSSALGLGLGLGIWFAKKMRNGGDSVGENEKQKKIFNLLGESMIEDFNSGRMLKRIVRNSLSSNPKIFNRKA